MRLTRLIAHNVRVLASLDLATDAELVVLAGPNGSGKTSVLEAIHVLGTARSFRTHRSQDLITRGRDALLVRGEFDDAQTGPSSAAVEKPRIGSARLRLSGEEVRAASKLARHLPLVTITPDSQRILSDGADARRRLLDWLLFHVEPAYNSAHGRYRQALRQRNAMLRGGQTGTTEREAWNAELAAAADLLERLRQECLGRTLTQLESALGGLSPLPITLAYEPGWDPGGEDLAVVLSRSWDQDVRRGFTSVGPHRADLQFRVHGRPAQHVVSRGEGKVLVAAVMAGFAKVMAVRLARRPIVLVDELASELDLENRRSFSRALAELGMQTFVTTVSEDLVDTTGWAETAVFRVDQGRVSPVLQ